ncbi:MAG TPA: hypothetical protein VE196_12170, partial [Pseudonocardiaceae bacterium]|nr:hypothetical protein [Pseudonocardiaceae bacterium]
NRSQDPQQIKITNSVGRITNGDTLLVSLGVVEVLGTGESHEGEKKKVLSAAGLGDRGTREMLVGDRGTREMLVAPRSTSSATGREGTGRCAVAGIGGSARPWEK